MNHTNHTNIKEESVICVPGEHSSWDRKEIINLCYYIAQTIIAIVALLLGSCYLKKKERRHEKEREERQSRREQERLEREERDKIAEILSSEYITIEDEGILERIRKAKIHFEGILFWELVGDVKITGLDVLRYMCHPGNYKRCQTKKLEELRQDLNAIVRVFWSFRIKLPPTGKCPENIKEELGPLIIELGEMTVPFVTEKKRHTISKVLEYFDGKPLALALNEETKIEARIPYVRDHLRFGDATTLHTGHENMEYVNIGYENTGFELYNNNLYTQHRNYISRLMLKYEYELQKDSSTEMLKKNMDVVNDIKHLWTHNSILVKYMSPNKEMLNVYMLNVYVLNAVRLFYYLVCQTNGNSIESDENFLELTEKMKIICSVTDGQLQKEDCERHISDIRRHLDELCRRSELLEKNQLLVFWEKQRII